MQGTEQGVTVYNQLVWEARDEAGQLIIKREKTGKLLTSRDICLRGGPEVLNGRILSGIVGDSLEFPTLGLLYRKSDKRDIKGREVFTLSKEGGLKNDSNSKRI